MNYLFIVIPNNSGSNYVKRQIGRCRKAVLIESGQKLFGKAGLGPKPQSQIWSLSPEIYGNPDNYQWKKIEELWTEHWKQSPKYDGNDTDLVLVENSQAHPIRTGMLAEHFENCFFIFAIRNPYATCLSATPVPNKKMAEHWIKVAELQLSNKRKYANSVFFTYEEMCEKPVHVEELIKTLVPQLDDFSMTGIKNGNQKHFETLKKNKWELRKINKILRKRADLMEILGYEFIG